MKSQTFSKVAPECPYCGHEQSHDGGHYYNEDLTVTECGKCDRQFEVEVSNLTFWTCHPLGDPA